MTAFFCDSKPEAIEHLFWYSDRIFPLWNALTQGIRLEKGIEVDFSLECVLLDSAYERSYGPKVYGLFVLK